MSTDIRITATPAPGKPGRFITCAVNGVGELFRNIIDLNSKISRDRFIQDTMQKAFGEAQPAGSGEGVRAGLEDQLLAFAKAPPGDPNPTQAPGAETVPVDPRVAALAAMPENIRHEAAQLLQDPDLLRLISNDIRVNGVAGEEDTALLVFLMGCSAQLPRPLSGIIKGPSSSGKSYIVQKVSEMFPPEVTVTATQMTTNALFYFPPGTLIHRFVVGGERSRVEDDDQAEATRALREMIESGRLSKAVPIKIGDRYQTELIEQDGPIAFVETTTSANVFNEDANRCLMMSTDEREVQTKRIIAATAKRAAGKVEGDLERMKAVHYAVQRMLPRVDVVIPFAEALADLYPTTRIESRRELRHLIQLVKAIALLHFQQRQRDDSGLIIAIASDYDDAARLAAGPFGTAASGVSDGARRFLEQLQERYGQAEFTTTRAKEASAGCRSSVHGWLSELASAGAVEQTTPPRGKVPAVWKLASLNATPTGLPSAEDVMKQHFDRTHGHKP